MKSIKVVKRIGLPQTNSSSDHSIIICSDNTESNVFSFQPSDDGCYHVTGGRDFGWEWEKFNDVETKLTYTCAIIYGEPGKDDYDQEIQRVKDVFKKFTGYPLVVDWDEEYDPEDEDSCYHKPSVDHQSSDIVYEIMETNETIKDFIFNPNSWLFLGNDNSDADEFFYSPIQNKKQEPEAIGWIDLGGKIGRLDFDIQFFPNNESIKDGIYEISRLLSNIVFNKDTGEIIDLGEFGINDIVKIEDTHLGFENSYPWIFGGKYYLLWISREAGKKLRDIHKGFNYNEEGYQEKVYDAELKFLNSLTSKDFKKVEIHINSKEFGTL